jgi:hypothetical protein
MAADQIKSERGKVKLQGDGRDLLDRQNQLPQIFFVGALQEILSNPRKRLMLALTPITLFTGVICLNGIWDFWQRNELGSPGGEIILVISALEIPIFAMVWYLGIRAVKNKLKS